MRNFKKVIALVLAVALMMSTFTVAFAAEPTSADKLVTLGLLSDASASSLSAGLTRKIGLTMILKTAGFDQADATAAVASKFTDTKDWTGPWANLAAAEGITLGTTATTFGGDLALSGEQFLAFALRANGVPVVKTSEAVSIAITAGLLPAGSTVAAKFTKGDAANVMMAALVMVNPVTKVKLIDKLIADKVVTEAAAVAAGLKDAAPAAVVTGAVALNSKVIEVSLKDAVTSVDAAAYAVKDSASAAVAVASVVLAPWDAAGKTVLVTLGADTAVGKLYTLTSGAVSVNFGGKAVDTTKPTVTVNASAPEYNTVTLDFSDAVLTLGTVVAVEKYGTKAALNVVSVKYVDKDTVTVTTDAQKGATLYGLTITGFADAAGNVMDKNDTATFVGTAMPTDALKVVGASGQNNAEEFVVEFNLPVDVATIAAANFKVEEMYGTKAVLPVTAAVIAVKDQVAKDGSTALTDATAKLNVILTVPGTKDATLYKITVSGLATAYGKAISTTAAETYTTAVGKVKPSTVVEFTGTPTTVNSNTTVTVNFGRKMDKALAETVANYAVVEVYGTKAALAVSKAELNAAGTGVKLTVAAMSNVLYKLTVTNVKDVFGNAIKTESSANVTNFAGVSVAAKITAISSAVVQAGGTTLRVVFDQAVGATATDVSHYVISDSVGYPEAAVVNTTVDATGKTVDLTVPKTTVAKVYTITVKGLENADGVAMATDGVKTTFVGLGNAPTLPELVAVMATDEQTVKVYFDRDVTDSSIEGATKIWVKSTNTLVVGALSYVHNAAITTDLVAATEYAYQDPTNKNVLIVRVDTAAAYNAANKDTTLNAFKLVGDAAKFATDKNNLLFNTSEADVAPIEIDAVLALNSTTIRVYFNQAVYGTFAAFASINTTEGYNAGGITLSNPTVDSTKKIVDFKLSGALANATYWFNVNPAVSTAVVGDAISAADVVTIKDKDSVANNVQYTMQFAGTATAAPSITDVYAMMADEKTLIVYYPELMASATTGTGGGASISARDFDNYTIVNAAGVAVTMADTTAFDASTDIGQIEYDDATNTAKITLNQVITTAVGGAFVKVNALTANATQTKVVIDGTTTISKQFAISTAASAKVLVSSAEYTAATKTLKITFNQLVKTSSDWTEVADAAGTTTAVQADTDLLAAITFATGTTVTGALIDGITGYDADGVATASTNGAFVKSITIVFEAGYTAANAVGEVQIKAAASYVGINGNGGDVDSKTTFAQ